MSAQPFNVPRLSQMASGHLYLILSEEVRWEDFPEIVADTLNQIGGGTVKSKADGVDNRVWSIEHEGFELTFAFQDHPIQASLESDSDTGDEHLKQIFQRLKSVG